jgi:hypothetical protein
MFRTELFEILKQQRLAGDKIIDNIEESEETRNFFKKIRNDRTSFWCRNGNCNKL